MSSKTMLDEVEAMGLICIWMHMSVCTMRSRVSEGAFLASNRNHTVRAIHDPCLTVNCRDFLASCRHARRAQ
jgi:hypothetical protein